MIANTKYKIVREFFVKYGLYCNFHIYQQFFVTLTDANTLKLHVCMEIQLSK